MKKHIERIPLLAVLLLLSALPVLAAEVCPVSFGEYDKLVQSDFKNQCLIVARNCTVGTDSVQQRVNDLRVEIAKGRYVYSSGEIGILKEQLKWIEADSANRII